MKSTKPRVILFLAASLLLTATITTHAQKLPNVQKASMRAPADIKIDGQLSEWNDKFQAHNSVDGLWYTLSNDDDNLYLTVMAPYQHASEKVIIGGILLTVSNATDNTRKKDKTNKSILFPVLNKNQSINFAMSFVQLYTMAVKNKNVKRADSLFKSTNERANIVFKKIQTNGLINIKDEIKLISDAADIQVSVQFNKKMDLIYELKLPLKYLGLSINNPKAFSYNIKLNGFNESKMDNMSAPPGAPAPSAPQPLPGTAPGVADDDSMDFPTDFWGEYALAK